MTTDLRYWTKCPACQSGGARLVSDYVRGDRHEFCHRCDGYRGWWNTAGSQAQLDRIIAENPEAVGP